jgi:hypothetical protein
MAADGRAGCCASCFCEDAAGENVTDAGLPMTGLANS